MRSLHYSGPKAIEEQAADAPPGVPILSRESLRQWLHEDEASLSSEGGWATYVVDLAGRLLLAPRRTEHVACASGKSVLAAGEIRFAPDGEVIEVSNNSTGYCPAEDCWASVSAALKNAAVPHPVGFTFVAHFRRCPRCGERNLVKDDWYSCALCEADLPTDWNF